MKLRKSPRGFLSFVFFVNWSFFNGAMFLFRISSKDKRRTIRLSSC